MKPIAYPNNNSWKQFKGNWKKVVIGGLKFLVKHPISGPKVIIPRLRFAFQKKSLTKPVLTPQKFTIKDNAELLVYTQIFIEQNLLHRPLIDDFRFYPNPVIIDIGYNCGFVSKWLYGYNQTASFFGVEVMEHNIIRSKEMDREMFQASFIPEAGIGFAPEVQVFHKAAWSVSNKKITINVGDVVSTQRANRTTGTFDVETIAVDDLPSKGPVFLLKIDTDGSNIEVLEGARETLKRTRWLLVEEDPGVLKWCRENLGNWKETRLTHCDLVFKNDNS